jgi:hypothetical protein
MIQKPPFGVVIEFYGLRPDGQAFVINPTELLEGDPFGLITPVSLFKLNFLLQSKRLGIPF